MIPLPLQFLLVMLVGWVSRQQEVIASLEAEIGSFGNSWALGGHG